MADRASEIAAGSRLAETGAESPVATLHMPKPLVTFALFAYQQERFVREAVEGALAQTYSPLEIILSDDCSPDRGFSIMQEMAAGYRGPHAVIPTQSPTNLGLADHLNRVAGMCHGELIVVAAGDDISVPERTQATVDAWLSGAPRPISLFSNACVIDEAGQTGKLWFDAGWKASHNHETCALSFAGFPWVLGATHAFSPKLFTVFGPLDHGILQEDFILSVRARLLGNIQYLEAPLVRYRRHTENLYDASSNRVATRLPKRHFDNRRACFQQIVRDLETLKRTGGISARTYWYSRLVSAYQLRMETCEEAILFDPSSFGTPLRSLELKSMCFILRILRRLEYLLRATATRKSTADGA